VGAHQIDSFSDKAMIPSLLEENSSPTSRQNHKLAKKYRLIKFEDLNVKVMVKNHHLAKSIHDAGWSQFISIVVHKAEEAGGQVEVVNANGTSTTCSRCGHQSRMPLSVRVYRCGNCGLIIDRDHNSSLNIEERKGRIVPSGRRRDAVVKEPRTYRSIVGDLAQSHKSEPESPTIMRPRV
jgi:IS605 OrfB family transposase